MYVCMYVAMSFLLKQLIPQDNHIAKHYATLCHPTPYMHKKIGGEPRRMLQCRNGMIVCLIVVIKCQEFHTKSGAA